MPLNPKRGEVWYVDLEPTRGAEMKKTRPCLVISVDTAGRLPLRLVAPITGWQEAFAAATWIVRIESEPGTGLSKTSAADMLQMRGADLSRFDPAGRVGVLSADQMRARRPSASASSPSTAAAIMSNTAASR